MFKQIALAAVLACLTGAAHALECKLQPPGWDCNAIGQAYGPLPGWHAEADKVTGRTIMIPDNLTPHGPLAGARIAVIDTARAWWDLTNPEREAIYRGEKIIDDFIEVVEEPGCRERYHNDTLYCRDTWKRINAHIDVGEDEEVPL
jgi:hypothetical protein